VNRLPVTLLCALLPQLLLALLSPAFVVCQEGDGASAVELSMADCCQDDVPAPAGAEELCPEEEDCGGCQDAVLALSLQRDEGATTHVSCACPSAVPPSAWSQAARLHLLTRVRPRLERDDPTPTVDRTVNLRC
jgi:hypothetical protein